MKILSFKEWMLLDEARKNPEMNTKISAYDALKPYKNEPDVYISFTSVDKIGINPKSSFQSPSGIYCYPLKEVWEKYNVDRHRTLEGVLPFASRNPYIWVIKNISSTFINDMYTEYNNSNYEKDIVILRKLVYNISKENQKDIFKNFRKMYRGLTVHTTKSEEFLDKYIDILSEGFISKVKSLFTNNNFERELFEVLISLSLENRKEKNSISAFYTLTELIAKLIGDPTDKKTTSLKWNAILRKCGYTGLADKSGQGYIYVTEPIQAVFFSRTSFEVLEKVLNKSYEKFVIYNLETCIEFIKTNEKYVLEILEFFIEGSIPRELEFVTKIKKSNKNILTDTTENELNDFIKTITSLEHKQKLFISRQCNRIKKLYNSLK